MPDDKPPLTEEEIREIARRRAEALKRVQEMHQKAQHEHAGPGGGKGGKGPKQAPPKGRAFRHQGR